MHDCKGVQTPFAKGTVLEKCCIENCIGGDIKKYQSLIENLNYVAVVSRPDIAHAVSKLAQFSTHPHQEHFIAAKRVFRYLRANPKGMLTYKPNSQGLVCFSDADWAADSTDRRSYSGFAVLIDENLIAWESRKQSVVAPLAPWRQNI
ncbi:secreted RxLR effector protein 161-like [Teleopsis dalmanni]|uniref:secreted RxLR effector protein 161-like n=1 Tax=Teleopsis dalmanni TaxID=139649 RepID=UPI0018CDEC36|nr:secreted RxLR effector protein 161-like [Teleopsis dalmanni]